MNSGLRIVSLSIASLAMMYASVQASESYAQEHPMMGMQLKMEYCIDAVREANKPMQDIGCKVGHGYGKEGVKRDIIRQLVERINKNKQSYEYVQLVSIEGLRLVFRDDSVGSKGTVIVWQNADTGRMRIKMEREE
jgi:hypothetical protein